MPSQKALMFTCTHCQRTYEGIERFPLICRCGTRDFGPDSNRNPQPPSNRDRPTLNESIQTPSEFSIFVGSNLALLIRKLGLGLKGCFDCAQHVAQMNSWGIDGCRENREEILRWLRESAAAMSWTNKITAAANAVLSGLVTKIDRRDPAPGLLDEAIRLAEERL